MAIRRREESGSGRREVQMIVDVPCLPVLSPEARKSVLHFAHRIGFDECTVVPFPMEADAPNHHFIVQGASNKGKDVCRMAAAVGILIQKLVERHNQV